MATLHKEDNDDDNDNNNNNKSATFDCYCSDVRDFSYLGSHEFSFGKYRLFG